MKQNTKVRSRSLAIVVVATVLVVTALAGAIAPAYAQQDKPGAGGAVTVLDEAGPVKSPAEAQFRKVALAKERTYYAGDADRYLSFFADNAVSVQPGVADITGKKAMEEGVRTFLAGYHPVEVKFIMKKVTLAGDYATRQGDWVEVWEANDGSAKFSQHGRCILAWQKVNGQWKVVTEFINYLDPPTDLPLAGQ
jgi:ketosteroid isomerase-like protein